MILSCETSGFFAQIKLKIDVPRMMPDNTAAFLEMIGFVWAKKYRSAKVINAIAPGKNA